MKRILLIMGVMVCSATLFAVASSKNNAVPYFLRTLKNASFNWTVTTFDFGKIKLNIPVTQKFTFKNSGETPLIITSVQASCGCTVAEYSKDPIEPGGEGFVKATYNAAKVGVFSKTVTVNANTEEGSVQLMIKGEVEE